MLTTPPSLAEEVQDILDEETQEEGQEEGKEKDWEQKERPKTRIDPKTGREIKTRRTQAEMKAEREAKEQAKKDKAEWKNKEESKSDQKEWEGKDEQWEWKEGEQKEGGEENKEGKQGEGEQKEGEKEKEEEKKKEEEEEQDGVVNNEKELEIIDCAVKANIPLLLIWETWTGKTTLVRHEAKKKGKELVRINLNWQTGREELIGKYVLIWGETIWQDWPMVTALRYWHWILLDEINAALPEVLFVIQALAESNHGKLGHILLAEKDWEVIIPHPDTRLFWTANPSDKYIGTKDFNPATLSRFLMLQIDVLSQEKERELLGKKFPKMGGQILRITEIWQALRRLHQSEQIEYFCSTRDLVYMAELIQSWLKIEQSFEVVILNKIQTEIEKTKIQSEAGKVLKITIQKSNEIVSEIESIKRTMQSAVDNKKKLEEYQEALIYKENQLDEAIKENHELKVQVQKFEELKKLIS